MKASKNAASALFTSSPSSTTTPAPPSFRITSLLFGYYVSIGTVQLLATKASERNGRLQYNTSFVVLLIELAKVLAAFGLSCFSERKGMFASRKTTIATCLSFVHSGGPRYAAPAFFYAVQNNMNILAIPMLHPHIFQLFNNLKIVSAAIFTALLLGKRYGTRQWLGMLTLVVACCVSRLDVCVSAWKQVTRQASQGGAEVGIIDDEKDRVFLLGLTLALASVATSGVAGVVNEYVLKIGGSTEHGFWQKNRFTYQWGVVFNLVPLVWKMNNYHGDAGRPASTLEGRGGPTSSSDFFTSLFTGFTPMVWFLVAVNAALGVSISLLFRYFDNVTKSFGGPMILFLTTFFSWLLLGSEIGIQFIAALGIYSLSVYLYADWRCCCENGIRTFLLPTKVLGGKIKSSRLASPSRSRWETTTATASETDIGTSRRRKSSTTSNRSSSRSREGKGKNFVRKKAD
ncbi:unnamed protein product [Amoebophrya sp. A25]|nr:unnamed protein product [Amoebophrya sp. A25]|eukprot:GSA25T00008579001.1